MEFDYSQQPGLKINKKLNQYNGQRALVTIITPYYNAGKYFEQTFNSVMNQTFPWFEWIIVNDGSTHQEDIQILDSFAKRDGRIRVILQKNRGPSYARNTGFKNADTDIVIPLDADDLISPQYVEYIYFGLLYHPDAAWCYTHSIGFDAQEYLWKYSWDAERLKTYNYLVCTAAVRKKDWQEIGGYKIEKEPYHEDWRFWLDMLSNYKYPVCLNGCLFWYRRLKRSRLSGVIGNSKSSEFCEKIIEEAAKSADGSIKAIEYPQKKTHFLFQKPQLLSLGSNFKIPKDEGKIRLLMLIPWMVMGGADKFNLQLAGGLDKKTYEISIITTVPSDNEWQQRFERFTDEIFNLPDFLDPAHFADFVSYYIDSRQIDVLFVSNSQAGYYMTPWIKSQFPDLLIIDYVHMEEWYWKAGGHARTSASLGEAMYRTYVCNHATRDVMVRKMGRNAESVKTIHIGVDHEEFDRTKIKSGYLYNLLEIDESRPLILFPCRICPQKRPFLMLEIADRIGTVRSDILFVVIGDGEQLDELKNAIRVKSLENNVVCIGRCEDMRSCYKDAFLTLICSLKEGLALTAYESCSMGIPVVSSDAGGQSDLIDDTVGALIQLRQSETDQYDYREFDEDEINDYVTAIQDFLDNSVRYKNCSINCRKKIENEFSLGNMVKIMEQEIANGLKHMHGRPGKHIDAGIAGELYMVFNLLEERECVCNDVWNSQCYFEKCLHEERDRTRSMSTDIERLEEEKRLICNDLQAIKGMKLYRILEWYGNFVGKNPVGRQMWKLIHRFLQNIGKGKYRCEK